MVSLITGDVDSISRLVTDLSSVVIRSPILVVLVLLALYRAVGHAVWSGVLVVVLMGILNRYLIGVNYRLYHLHRSQADARIRLTSVSASSLHFPECTH